MSLGEDATRTIQGSGFRILGFRVQGLGFRV